MVKAANGDCAVEVEIDGKPKQFSPPEISAMILAKLKADPKIKLVVSDVNMPGLGGMKKLLNDVAAVVPEMLEGLVAEMDRRHFAEKSEMSERHRGEREEFERYV